MVNYKKTISIVGYDVSNDDKQMLFKTSFACIKCKHVQTCVNSNDCNFINYIRQRVPSAVFNHKLDTPVLNIGIVNREANSHALRTILHAKRLRKIKSESQYR